MRTDSCTCSGGDPRDGTHEDWCLTRAETPEQFTETFLPETIEERDRLDTIVRAAIRKTWSVAWGVGASDQDKLSSYVARRRAYDEMREKAEAFGLEPPAPFLEEQPTPTPNPYEQ